MRDDVSKQKAEAEDFTAALCESSAYEESFEIAAAMRPLRYTNTVLEKDNENSAQKNELTITTQGWIARACPTILPLLKTPTQVRKTPRPRLGACAEETIALEAKKKACVCPM